MEFDANKTITYFRNVLALHYSDFNGRVARKDYWLYVAVYVVIAILVSIVQRILGIGLVPLLALAMLLPNAGMTARRIQDTGRPGNIVWLLMIPVLILNIQAFLFAIGMGFFFFIGVPFLMMIVGLVALVGGIYILYLCVQPGTPGANAFGPEPPVET